MFGTNRDQAHLGDSLAALGYTIAAGSTTTGNRLRSSCDERREGHNGQKEGRCTEEHFAWVVGVSGLAVG